MVNLKNLRKDKKGSLQDIVFIGIALLIFAVVILVGFRIMSAIDVELQASGVVDTQGKAASTTLTGHYPGIIDNSFLLLAIGMAIVALILAAMVKINPIFIPLFFIALVIVVFISGLLSNIYQEMAANPELSSYASQLTFTTTILTWLPIIITVFGILLIIVQYKLWDQDQ